MLRQAENVVRIEGILSEVDLKTGSFTRNGQNVDSISGIIKIKTTQQTKDGVLDLEIPVHMFAAKQTNKGTLNPAYTNLEKVINEYTSIAAAGNEDEADRVRITNGNITMNEYYGQNGNFISFPRIQANFISKVKKEDYAPKATFRTEIYIINKGFEVDADGIETNKFKVTAALPQYGGKVDVVPFYITNPNVIDAASASWSEGDTAKCQGYLNFTHETQVYESKVDFGESTTETRTITVSELIINGGGQPMDGDFAYSEDEIRKALVERKERLEEQKNKSSQKKTSTANSLSDLGF